MFGIGDWLTELTSKRLNLYVPILLERSICDFGHGLLADSGVLI